MTEGATTKPSAPAAAGPRLVMALAELLQREGVSFLSCYPTSPLIDAASRSDLRPVLCRQERVGVGIADGYTRVTAGDPPGVFGMQWGPGIENAYAGIATAYADSVPMLLLPLGYAQDRADAPRVHSANRLAQVAKSVERIRRPDDLAAVMRRAFSLLRSGRPGPVVVEIPTDLALQPLSGPLDYEPTTVSRPAGDPAAITRAAELLVGAERPVILAGQGVLYAGATGELIELAEALDAPVATSMEGKSAFPEDHPLALGAGGLVMSPAVRDFLADADVVLGLGTSFTNHFLAVDPPTHAKVVHVSIDELDLNKDCRADCAIHGDARLVAGAVLAEVRERLTGAAARKGAADRVAAVLRSWRQAWAPLLESNERPINPYRIVHELNGVLAGRPSIVTHDSGSPRDQILPFHLATEPHGYLGWGKSHALGAGLGLIMGAKLARPEATCVNFMGDAAFGMVGLDFETAVRAEIPIMTVVSNNSTMAIETPTLKVTQERYRGRDIGGEYADLAAAMGGWSRRVEDPEGIRPALEDAIRQTEEGRPALVEIITSPQMTPFSCRGGERERSEP